MWGYTNSGVANVVAWATVIVIGLVALGYTAQQILAAL